MKAKAKDFTYKIIDQQHFQLTVNLRITDSETINAALKLKGSLMMMMQIYSRDSSWREGDGVFTYFTKYSAWCDEELTAKNGNIFIEQANTFITL